MDAQIFEGGVGNETPPTHNNRNGAVGWTVIEEASNQSFKRLNQKRDNHDK